MRIVFFQFAHNGAVSLNGHKHQAFGMQFAENKFRHNDTITLSFSKLVSHESNDTAELGEEVCH